MAESTTKTKKKLRGSDIFIIILVIAAIAGGGYYLVTNYLLAPHHSVTVNDKEIEMKNSVQTLIDEGFVLCNVTGKISYDALDMNVKAKEICSMTYFIGTADSASSAKCSGVQITVANFSNSDQTFAQCSIYEIKYEPKFQDDGITVKIDGTEMKSATIEEWVAFLKEKDFPFSTRDYEDLSSGHALYVSASKDTHKYSCELNADSTLDENNEIFYIYTFGSLTITRDVKVEYTTK